MMTIKRICCFVTVEIFIVMLFYIYILNYASEEIVIHFAGRLVSIVTISIEDYYDRETVSMI